MEVRIQRPQRKAFPFPALLTGAGGGGDYSSTCKVHSSLPNKEADQKGLTKIFLCEVVNVRTRQNNII